MIACLPSYIHMKLLTYYFWKSFTCLLPTFILCFRVKLNLTVQKHFHLCFWPYFALFTLYLLQSYQKKNSIGLKCVDVCCFHNSINKPLVGCIDSSELNQIWKYLMRMYCEVHKENDTQNEYSLPSKSRHVANIVSKITTNKWLSNFWTVLLEALF